MITTAQAAAILGLSRSQTNRVGRALTRERHIINGRACWLYDEAEVRNLQRNRPGRPRKKQ